MPAQIDCHPVPLGRLLTSDDCCFAVPPFQRDYSWTKLEVDQLWEDILNTIDEARNEHFMGAIVVNTSQSPESLIDGQQRLATISLLLCVIKDIAKETENHKLFNLISDRYLGSMNIRTDEIEPKLILNNVNNQFYKDEILDNKGIDSVRALSKNRSLEETNSLLLKAYLHLYQHVHDRIESVGDYSEGLIQLIECIRDRLILIKISVADEANAYLIFETLNDRGLELSVVDLLKNYLFSRANSKLPEVKRKWEELNRLVEKLGAKKFIRHYWLSSEGVIREKELYHALKKKIRNQNNVINFINRLRKSAEFYGALEDPQHILWAEHSSSFKENLELLNLFDVNLCYPVLIAAAECLPDDLFEKVLKMVCIISFRYNKICDRSPNNLEKVYSDTAKFIREQSPKTAKQIFERLSAVYPEDGEFTKAFEKKTLTKRHKKLARYILSEINNSYSSGKELVTNTKSTELTLEHILPQNPDQEWVEYFGSSQKHDDYIYRLGNMTLVENPLNKKLANKSFEQKCKLAYEKSQLKISNTLPEFQAWRADEIDKRQKQMAKVAKQIWRLDYT